MRKKSIKINTLVIILSIVIVYIQFFCYYFFDKPLAVICITLVTSLLLTHCFLEASLSYEAGFLQTLTTTFLSLVLILVIYWNQTGNLLVYHDYVKLILLLNWLVPLSYLTVRSLYDKGPRFVGYKSYFIKSSILFLLLYLLTWVQTLFLVPIMPPATTMPVGTNNFIPFWSIAGLIESYINQDISLKPIVIYLLCNSLLYLPFGFYVRLLYKKIKFIPRMFLFLLFPIIGEVLQLFLKVGRCNIDDLILALVGSLLGSAVYLILDRIFLKKTEYHFLEEKSSYSFMKYIQYLQ